MSRRIEFQHEWVSKTQGLIANIGCADDPLRISQLAPGRVINLDLNMWNVPDFIQCDAHHLPLKDNAVELALCGDILEHVPEPLQVLQEAKRISRRVVATIFEDYRLPSPGRHIEFAHKRQIESLQERGYSSTEEHLKSTGLCLGEFSESLLSHGSHIWWFSVEKIKEMVEALDMKVLYLQREPEVINEGRLFWNWLFAADKKEEV